MPIFEFDGQQYEVKEHDIEQFARDFPDAMTKQDAAGQEIFVKAQDYQKFLQDFPRETEPQKAKQAELPELPLETISKGETPDLPLMGTKEEQPQLQEQPIATQAPLDEQLSEEAYQPLTEEEQWSMGVATDKMLRQNNAVMDWFENKAEEHIETINDPVKLAGIGGLRIGQAYNKDTGKVEQTYKTLRGNETFNAEEALSDDYYYMMSSSPSISQQLRDAEKRLAEVDEKLAYRRWEIEAKKVTEEKDRTGIANFFIKMGERDPEGIGDERRPDNSQDYLQDDEYQALRLQARKLEETIQQLKDWTEKDNRGEKFWKDFWRETKQAVFSLDSWDFGEGQRVDASAMLGLAIKAQKGEQLSEAEQEAMYEMYLNDEVMSLYGDLGRGARWGQIAGHSVPFMAKFALTQGGFSSISGSIAGKVAGKIATTEAGKALAKKGISEFIKSSAKGTLKKTIAEEGVKRFVGSQMVRLVGLTAEDMLIRAPLMVAATQGRELTANIIKTKLGDVVYNEETGQYHFTNDKGWGEAIWEESADMIIENSSEMWGAQVPDLLTIGKTLGLRNLTAAILKHTRPEKALGMVAQAMGAMGVNGYFGEVGEEYYGHLWRTMLGLQASKDQFGQNLFFDKQFHEDIWGGLAMSIGMSGAVTTAGVYSGKGIKAANEKYFDNKLNNASLAAAEIYTSELWDAMKSKIDYTPSNELSYMAGQVMQDKTLTDDQREVLMNYLEAMMMKRGYNLAVFAEHKGEARRNPIEDNLNNAYIDGYEATTVEDARNIYASFAYRANQMRLHFGEDVLDEGKGKSESEWLQEARRLQEEGSPQSLKQSQVILSYLNAVAMREGMIDFARHDIDTRVADARRKIGRRTHRDNGQIVRATLNQDDRQVFVISGDVVMHDDGKAVNHQKSSPSIIIRDEITGKLEQVSPEAILKVEEGIDAIQAFEETKERIEEEFGQQHADTIDGKPQIKAGDKFILTRDNQPVEVTVVADANGIIYDEKGNVYINDGEETTVVPLPFLQQVAENAKAKEIEAFEQERERNLDQIQGAIAEEQANKPREYNQDDEVIMLDDSGNAIKGAIVSPLDGENKFTIEFETTYNGKRVQQFTPDEITAKITEHNGESTIQDVATNEPIEATIEEEETAISRVPQDGEGNLLYTQTDADTAWDALVEQTEGNTSTATMVAQSMVEDHKKAVKQAEKELQKIENPKLNGLTVEQRVGLLNEQEAKKAQAQALLDEAKAQLMAWEDIANVQARREEVIKDEIKAQKEAEKRARAEEEKAQKLAEDEARRREIEAIEGVPDVVHDNPKDARARGYRRVNGYQVERQGEVNAEKGKEVEVKFSDKKIVKGRLAVIDVNDLQPSHEGGQRNPKHFIDEAQTKERKDADSIGAAENIASNIRPEEITSSVTAYTGAPSVNSRGEVIQGNNRTNALKLMYSHHKDQAEIYKQYLKENAEQFGLTAEQIDAMDNPVIVNILDVNDNEAIELGQFVAQDTESGGVERIKPKNALQKMGEEMGLFAQLLLDTKGNEDMTLSELIDKNGAETLSWMGAKGYITPTQIRSAYDSRGNLTAEAKNDLKGILYQSIFQNASPQLEEMFNLLPVKAQRAILSTAFRDYDSPRGERMIDEIQNSIRAFYELLKDSDFAKAGNLTDARDAMIIATGQGQMSFTSEESVNPLKEFSNFALELAARYKGQTQKQLQDVFNRAYDLIQGKLEDTLLETVDKTPRTLKEAIKEIFNIEYDGKTTSNNVGSNATTSERGERGGNRHTETGERGEGETQSTDSRGGTTGVSGRVENTQQDNNEEVATVSETTAEQSPTQTYNVEEESNKARERAIKKQNAKKRAEAERLAKELNVEIEIIEKAEDVTHKKASEAISNGGTVKGWFDVSGNKVAIFLPHNESIEDVQKTILHEVVAHRGLKALFGKDHDKFLDAVWNSMSEKAQKEYLAYAAGKKARATVKNKRKAADEYIAFLAENVDVHTEQEKTIWQTIIDWIREVILNKGLFDIRETYNDADLEALIRLSYNNLRNNEQSQVEQEEADGLAPQEVDEETGNTTLFRAARHGSPHSFDSENDDIRFRIGKRARQEAERLIKKRNPNISDEHLQESLDFLHSLDDNKENNKAIKIAIKWLGDDSIRLPFAMDNVRKAIDIAEKNRIDPMQYSNPIDIIEEFAGEQDKIEYGKYTHPDDIEAFTNKRIIGEGENSVAVYDVEGGDDGLSAVTHVCHNAFGYDTENKSSLHKWCLSSFTRQGEPTDSARNFWFNTYNSVGKKIAFQDGKPIAFMAHDRGYEGDLWWDLKDQPSNNLPLPNGNYLMPDGEVTEKIGGDDDAELGEYYEQATIDVATDMPYGEFNDILNYLFSKFNYEGVNRSVNYETQNLFFSIENNIFHSALNKLQERLQEDYDYDSEGFLDNYPKIAELIDEKIEEYSEEELDGFDKDQHVSDVLSEVVNDYSSYDNRIEDLYYEVNDEAYVEELHDYDYSDDIKGAILRDYISVGYNEPMNPRYDQSYEGDVRTRQEALLVEDGYSDMDLLFRRESANKQSLESKTLEEYKSKFENPEDIIKFALEENTISYGSKQKANETLRETVRNITENGKLRDDSGRNYILHDKNAQSRGKTSDSVIKKVTKRTVLKDFKESGFIEFAGTKIESPQDIADLFSIHRSPNIEKFHLIFVDDKGEILGTHAYTSNLSNKALLPELDVVSDMYRKHNASGVYFLHNHPSGNHKVSIQDVASTDFMYKKLAEAGQKLIGQVVIDTDRFSYINISERAYEGDSYNQRLLNNYINELVEEHEYKNAQANLFSERESLGTGIEASRRLLEISKALLTANSSKGAIVYLTSNLDVAAYDVFPDGAKESDIIKIAEQGYKNHLGARIAFVHDGSYIFPHRMPHFTLDVIDTHSGSMPFDTEKEETPISNQLWESQSKYGNDDIRFRIGNKRKADMKEGLLNKLTNATEGQVERTISEIEKLGENVKAGGDSKTEKVAYHWALKGTVILPEDNDKILQAIKVADISKVNPIEYNSPMELINKHDHIRLKEQPIDPDTIPTLTNKKDLGNGITIYNVTESDDSRENMRKIINTHLGEKRSPWCLLQGDENGKLTEQSARYWRHYNKTPKRVAFYEGRLIAFSANDSYDVVWWDKEDRPHGGIPITQKIPNDELGRTGTTEYDENTGRFSKYSNIHKGNKENGLYEEWYENGQRRYRATYKDGERNGLYEDWFEDGQRRYRATYKDGKENGLFEKWHDNVQLEIRATYKDGKRNGLYEAWFDDGQRRYRATYKDGKENGLSEEWNENGKLEIRATYKDGKRNGLYEEWYGNGQMYMRATYKDGKRNGLYEDWHDNGQLVTRATYKDGKRNGLYEEWYGNGQMYVRATYKDGERNGLYEEWYENGKLEVRANYKDGKENGLFEEWYENGQLKTRTTYKDGKENGLSERWHENGKRKSRINYKYGEFDGLYEEWYSNGQLEVRATFKNGKLDGRREQRYNNGQLEWRATYKDGKRNGLREEWYKNGQLWTRATHKDGKRNGLYERWHDKDLGERAIYDSDVRIKSLPTDVSLQELVDRGELDEKYLYDENEGEGVLFRKDFRFTITPDVQDEMNVILADAFLKGTLNKAPNGKQSNLNEEQWALVRTKNFKEWFGDWENDPENASKVVDENGEPLVVYHGTNAEFTEFRKDIDGIYFTNSEAEAQSYAQQKGGDIVVSSFLNMRKPNIVDQSVVDVSTKGYDGIIDREHIDYLGDRDYYNVFSPNQIKSATDNDGGFDGEKDDIRFRISGSRSHIPKVRGGWTKDKIIRYLKTNGTDTKGNYGIVEAIADYDTFEDFKNNIYYHGTTNYIPKGLKASMAKSEKWAEQYGGGGYGERYFGVSLTKRKRTAESFSGMKSHVNVYPVLLKKDANVIIREDLEDARDIEEHIVEFYEQGVDAVWIGGGEQELVVINPRAAILYKNGKQSFAVYGGFKSIQPTEQELREIYDKAKSEWATIQEQYKSLKDIEARKEFIRELPDIRFRIGNKRKADMKVGLLNKLTNATEEQVERTISEIEKLGENVKVGGDSKTEKVAYHWALKGTVILPEDNDKILQAIKVAEISKVNPMEYNSPMELINKHDNIKLKEQPIDPDTVPTLTNKKDLGNGITVYNVEESKDSRENMRKIINTHLGAKRSPWCLLQGDENGKLTAQSAGYWKHYNKIPKRVAFYEGRLIAFSANNSRSVVWWDKEDRPREGIPITQKIPNDELGRTGTTEYNEKTGGFGEFYNIHKGNTENGLYEEWYENGKLEIRATYKDGELNGFYEEWHDNGQLETRTTYKDGKENGLFERWHENGKLEIRATYKDGEENGLYERWHYNGQMYVRVTYKDGKRDGLWEQWYDNGQRRYRINYKDGKENGLYEGWNDNGKLKTRATYKDGEMDGDYDRWYDNGQLWIRTTYKDGKENGLYEEWHENGQMYERATYKDGGRNGLYERWYGNGQLKTRATYKDGKENGLFERWYENGKLATRTTYKDGKEDGLFERWYGNGQIYVRATYKDGKRNGLYKAWSYNGKLIERTIYYGNGERKPLPTDVSLQELVERGELDKKYLYDENGGEEVDKTLFRKSEQGSPHSFDSENDDIRFRIGNKRKADMKAGLLNKLTNATEEQVERTISEIEKLGENVKVGGDSKTEKVAYHWALKGTVILPEDNDKILQAIKVAEISRVNPMAYNSPMELINKHDNIKLKEQPIDPDTVPTLTNKKDLGNGITVYNVEESDDSRENMRKIINTHLGAKRSPWCLLQGDENGKLTAQSAGYWGYYDKIPKRVAFYGGRLIAFSANDSYDVVWWDKEDSPREGIPITQKIPNDELGRTGTTEYNEKTGGFGEFSNIHKGNTENGLYEEWDENGKLKTRATYKDGKRNGLYEEWHDNGQLKTRITYKDGELNGLYEGWNENGQRRYRATYKDGEMNGLYEAWNENGQLEIRTTYKDGKENGLFERWHDNGQLITRATYKDGGRDGLYEAWFGGGQRRYRITYKDGKRNGLYEDWYENGQMHVRTTYKDGKEDGLLERWHDNGQMYVRATYKDGERNGLWEDWSYNKDLNQRVIYYGNGEKKSLPTDVSLQELAERGELDKKYLYDENGGEEADKTLFRKSEQGDRSQPFHSPTDASLKALGEKYSDFIGSIFNDTSEGIRKEIIPFVIKNNWDVEKGTERFLASLAENDNYENIDPRFWYELKDKVIETLKENGVEFEDNYLTDNELRYMLWKNNQNEKGVFAIAEDIVMQEELEVGEYGYGGTLFRKKLDGMTLRQRYDYITRVPTKQNQLGAFENLGWRIKEAYQDRMLALKALMEEITRETGASINSSENAYIAEYSKSSSNNPQIRQYWKRYLDPIYKDTLRKFTKKGVEYEEILDYLVAKHGLERNVVFTRRNAERKLNEIFEKKSNKILKDAKLNGAEKEAEIEKLRNLRDQRLKRLAEGKFTVVRDFSGLTELTGKRDIKEMTAVAKQMVAKFEKEHKDLTDELWAKINKATKENLKREYESGLMTKETYDNVSNMFEYYIPLRGWDADAAGNEYEYLSQHRPNFSPTMVRAGGRTSLADDPLATIGFMAESAIVRGNRNLVLQKFLNFVLNNPTNLVTVGEQWYVLNNVTEEYHAENPHIPIDATADEIDSILKEFENRMRGLELQGLATKERKGLMLNLHTTKSEGQEHAVRIKRGGKNYVIYINGNPRAAQALNGLLNPDNNKGKALSLLMALKNFMAVVLTSKNIEFMFTNLSRDTMYATNIIGIKESRKYKKLFEKNLRRSITIPFLISKYEKDKLNLDKERQRYFEEFVTHGGETGFTQINSVEDIEKHIQESMGKAKKFGVIKSLPKEAWNAIWDGVEFLNRSAEDVSRFAVYMTSRQMGRDIAQSVWDAKEVTVNFNKKGSGELGARWMSLLYVFANAAIQSINTFVTNFANHPIKTTMAISKFVVYGALIPYINLFFLSMFGDDDEKKAYWDLSEWTRRNNILIWLPFTDKGFLKIPISHELRPFYGIGEILYSVLEGKEELDAGIPKMLEGFTGMLPIDFTGNAGEGWINFMPTVAQPIAQAYANTDYFGQRMYNDSEYRKHYPEWTNAYKGTAPLLVDASKWINEQFPLFAEEKGNDVYDAIDLPFALDNPAVVEHLLESYFGGVGRTISKTAKTIASAVRDEELVSRNIPIIGGFYQEVSDRSLGSQVNREFYKLKDEMELVRHKYNGYFDNMVQREGEEKEKYTELFNRIIESPDFTRFAIFKKFDSRLKKLNRNSKYISQEDKDNLQKQSIKLKEDLLKAIEALENNKISEEEQYTYKKDVIDSMKQDLGFSQE